MAEKEIDPKAEGLRIVKKYLSELGWARELKRMATFQLIPAIEKEPKLRQGDQMEENAEGNFALEVDRWRKEHTTTARDVLHVILNEMKRRPDLGFFGKRMIKRIKDDLGE